MFDQFLQDVRHALRGIRRSPAFAIPVILTLGFGIGANAAMFGVVDRLMFRPFPYLRDPGSIDRVYLTTDGWNRDNAYTIFPFTRYLDFRRSTRSFSQFAAFTSGRHGVGTGDAARERTVHGVSAGFFAFFVARPAIGRFFLADEDAIPRGSDVAVLSFDFWSAELGRRDVLGTPIQVGNATYTIVGVAPERFVGFAEGEAPAVFVPITSYAANQGGGSREDYFTTYSWDWTQVIVRRKPGVSREAATADLTQAFASSWDASRVVHPGFRASHEARLRAIAGAVRTTAGPDRGLEARTLLWVTGVAAIVLFIACANVANLFLARALRRRREVALRIALGVSRARLARQLVTEALLLAVLGCLAGISVAHWSGLAMRRLFIADATAIDVFADWRTWSVAMLAALIAALVTGLTPIVFAGRTNVSAALKAGARDGPHQRSGARAALLVTQGALSVALLIGAGLFVRSLHNVQHLRLGYDLDRLMLIQWERRGMAMDSSERAGVRRRLQETALGHPDVERASWVSNPPFEAGTSTMGFAVPGIDALARLGRFTYQVASHDYFSTAGTAILRGRSFGEEDRLGTAPVVVVSQAMAARLWPGDDPLGKCMRIGWNSSRPDTMPCASVIGVSENAVHDPAADLPMRYYLPEAQAQFGPSALLVRTRRDPASAAEDVRRALQAEMPGQAMVTVRTAEELFDARRRSWRVGATMFLALGILALVVAAVGVYGVMAYTVTQRMHELGVRFALGAQGRDIMRLVLGQGARFAVAGALVGSALALAAARWVEPLLFQQSATDPVVYVSVGALLLGMALLASGIPARRALRADPITVLRAE